MSIINSYSEFVFENSLNEGKINDMVKDIIDYVKSVVSKSDDNVKAKHIKKAKVFNKSDFVKFMGKLLPSYTDLNDKSQKANLIKKVDKYLSPMFTIVNIGTLVLTFVLQDKSFISIFGINILALALYNLSKDSLTKDYDVEINIRDYNKRTNRMTVDFSFYYSLGTKDKYRILYNSFVRLLKKYEGEEWANIEWGKDSNFGKPNPNLQHLIYLGFYPKEFVDLLHETALNVAKDRIKYAKENKIPHKQRIKSDYESNGVDYKDTSKTKLGYLKFDERKNMNYVNFYIQKLSTSQIISLSKKIDNLKLSYHSPIEYFEVKSKFEEDLKKRMSKPFIATHHDTKKEQDVELLEDDSYNNECLVRPQTGISYFRNVKFLKKLK